MAEKESLQKKLSELTKILCETLWKTRKDIILSVKAWEITYREAVRSCAKEIRLGRNDALGWVKENLMKDVPNGKEKDFKASGLCHAIQVYVNRMVLPKLVGSSKECVHCGGSGWVHTPVPGTARPSVYDEQCKHCKGSGFSKSASAEVKT